MITILTPTYNRAYTLRRLFESIKKQTYRSFEWIVVDDGSTDNTQDLLQEFKAKAQFKMTCVYQENGGKHRGLNNGVSIAQGEFIFIVDSDDYLPDNSLEIVNSFLTQIDNNQEFAGVSGNRCYPNGQKIGGEVCYEVLDTDPISFRTKYHVRGDMAEVWRTDVLKKYPFPGFPGEKFLSEGAVWQLIAKEYKLRYFNQPIYICDYLPDGLTRNAFRCFHNSPLGTMYVSRMYMYSAQQPLINRIKAAIHYWQYTADYNGKRPKELRPIWWSYFFYPIGCFLNFRGKINADV